MSNKDSTSSPTRQGLTEGLAALLDTKWTADETDRSKIRGKWAEDFSPYEITVPFQLRSQLIAAQHILCDLHQEEKIR